MSLHVPPGGLPHIPVRLAGWNTIAGANADTLRGESDVLSLDFLGARALLRDRATPANDENGALGNVLTYTSPSVKWIFNALGLLESGTTLRCDHDPSTKATSTDSVAIGWLTKTFTFAEAVTYTVGQWLRVSETAAPSTNYMIGRVTGASAGSVTIHVLEAVGSGTTSAWTLIEPLGALIENQQTNLISYSNTLTSWPNNWTGGTTVTAAQATGPDGTLSLARIARIDSAGDAANSSPFTAAASTAHHVSFFLAAGTSASCRLGIFDNNAAGWAVLLTIAWSAGVPSTSASSGASSIVYKLCGGGVYKVSFSFTAAATVSTHAAVLFPSIAGSDGEYIHAGFFQVEAGSYASSHIATAGATATRLGDDISVALSALPFSATEGSIVADYAFNGGSSVNANARYAWRLHNNTNNERLMLYNGGGANRAFVTDGGATVASLTDAASAAGVYVRGAFGWAVNDFAYSHEGAAALTDNAGTLPTVTTLTVGGQSAGSQCLGGHLRSLVWRPRRITNAQLQSEAA